MMTHVTHAGGDLVDLNNPRPEQFSINQIASQLSKICRYTGACNRFYSVARHSIVGARVALDAYEDTALARAMLLHDAHESVLGDIATPIMIAIDRERILQLKAGVDRAIQCRFEVDLSLRAVAEIDTWLLWEEWQRMMPMDREAAGIARPRLKHDGSRYCMRGNPHVDYDEFMSMAEKLRLL